MDLDLSAIQVDLSLSALSRDIRLSAIIQEAGRPGYPQDGVFQDSPANPKALTGGVL